MFVHDAYHGPPCWGFCVRPATSPSKKSLLKNLNRIWSLYTHEIITVFYIIPWASRITLNLATLRPVLLHWIEVEKKSYKINSIWIKGLRSSEFKRISSYKITAWYEIYNLVVLKNKQNLDFVSMCEFVLAVNRNYLADFIELFPYWFSRILSCILGFGIKARTDRQLAWHGFYFRVSY